MTTITLKNLAVIHGASTERSSYAINSVLVTKDGETVTTNGHLLLRVSGPDQLLSRELSEPKILPLDFAKDIKKSAKVNNIFLSNGGKTVKAQTGETTLEAEPLAGHFPDYQNIFDSAKSNISITFNVKTLEKMVKAAKEFYKGLHHGKNGPLITLNVKDGHSAMTFKTRKFDGQTLDGVIMPVNTIE